MRGGKLPAAGRIIESDACIAEGAAWLSARDRQLARAIDLAGQLPLRRRPGGFAALFSAITSQQVSTAAADAIWTRLCAAGFDQAGSVALADEAALRACGLSRQKARYGQALARAEVDYDALVHAPDREVIATLVAVPGIGRWTAEIYAMFALGRADILPARDLALQEAVRLLYATDTRPTERALRDRAEEWSPWRGVAARVLWAYYRVATKREGIR